MPGEKFSTKVAMGGGRMNTFVGGAGEAEDTGLDTDADVTAVPIINSSEVGGGEYRLELPLRASFFSGDFDGTGGRSSAMRLGLERFEGVKAR